MAKIGAPWVRPGARVRDTRYGTGGTVVAVYDGTPWIAWDTDAIASRKGRVYVARRAPWKHLRPALTLVKGKDDGK